MKTNLTDWLCAVCATLLIAVLIVQFGLKNQLTKADENNRETATRLSELMASEVAKIDSVFEAALARQRQQLDAVTNGLLVRQSEYLAGLENSLAQNERLNAEHVAAMTNTVSQQTAVLNRAFGKVIPIELPASLIKSLGALEARILEQRSWPKDKAQAESLREELRSIVKSIPPWAEDDLLPRLTPLRWNVQSLLVLSEAESAKGDGLEPAVEALANQLSTQPETASANIVSSLETHQIKLTNDFEAYRRQAAIDNAEKQLKGLKTDIDALTAWQRLSEWTNSPVPELRQKLRSQLFMDEINAFVAATQGNLSRLDAVTNATLRQAGYLRAMENVTAQRLSLLEQMNATPVLVLDLDNLAAQVEARITTEAEKQKLAEAERVRGYQQWALKQIKDFDIALNTIEHKTVEDRSIAINDILQSRPIAGKSLPVSHRFSMELAGSSQSEILKC